MPHLLSAGEVKDIVKGINDTDEEGRRAEVLKRHHIYNDGGKKFLLEQLAREFGADAIKEMRLVTLNLLKKMVNKRSTIYRRDPIRKPINGLKSDQALIDFYVEDLSMNQKMGKANRYFTLDANNVLYFVPEVEIDGNHRLQMFVTPPYLYSIDPEHRDRTKAHAFIFNAFTEKGNILQQDDVPSATGIEGYSREKNSVTKSTDKIASGEKESDNSRMHIIWTAMQHMVADNKGNVLVDATKDQTQFDNPIKPLIPVVNLAKERDNETWATQGGDMIDLTLAIQLGWTDLLTIAKHQGFSLLTITSAEEPTELTIGINKVIWLRTKKGQDTPKIDYVTGKSPLREYKELLMDLTGLLLTSNDMSPGSVTGDSNPSTAASGFAQLVQMADTLEAIEMDKPFLRDAEIESWQIIAAWHNWMLDNDTANEEAKVLGRFSKDFGVTIQFADVKPLESEAERLASVKSLTDMQLIDREGALKKLNPEMDEESITVLLKKIADQRAELMKEVLNESTDQDEEEAKEGDDEVDES